MMRVAMMFCLIVALPAAWADERHHDASKPQPLSAPPKPMLEPTTAPAASQPSTTAPTTRPATAPATQPATQPAAAPPAPTPAGGDLHPQVTLHTTHGDIVVELDGEKAPISTKNFVDYVEAGFYDGTIFHRIISNFMIQGGGYTPEFTEKQIGLRPPIKNEWQNGLKNVRGTIAMARRGWAPGMPESAKEQAANSATAQFFINVVDNPQLDQPQADGAAYAVFGKVIRGMDVVDRIRNIETIEHPRLPMGKVVPKEPVVILTAKVTGPYDREKLAARVVEAGLSPELVAYIRKVEAETGKKVERTASGLMYIILQEGTGPQPGKADAVDVHYTGTFLDGKKFDSSLDRNEPFTFSLTGGVIRGWLEGVALMKVGEKRRLIIPPELGYGPQGRPPVIPPNATLVFDIELLRVRGPI